MSFNEFSPELLIKVFSHLLDIPSKVRLERVNRKFRDCIRNAESWKFDTMLKMSEFQSDEGLRSFLGHTKVVAKFELDSSMLGSKYLATLFMFSEKLKVTHFSYGMPLDDCSKYDQLVACCLGKFTNTLKFARVQCCGNRECPIVQTLYDLLPLCRNLLGVGLRCIKDDDQVESAVADADEGNHLFLLDSLMDKSLLYLHLFNFSTVNGERLAAVCNSARGPRLSMIGLQRHCADGGIETMRFELDQFCQALEPEAARGIQHLSLEYIDCDWIEVLPTLPALFPNLTSLKIKHSPINPTAEEATNMAQALGGFLHASAQHEQGLTLDMTFTCEQGGERSFGRWLWKSIDLIEVWRSGTKRTTDMERWKRTLNQGNVTLHIQVE